MNKDIGIYKITNLINKKSYIGKSEVSIKERWRLHKCAEHNQHLKRAFKKYGLNNFKFKIIHYLKKNEDINKLEKKYILKYKSYNRNYGYNLTYGGDGCLATEETKRKIGKSNKGKKYYGKDNPFYGKHHTKEAKEKNKQAHLNKQKGEKNPFYGKHHSVKTKEINRQKHIGKKLGKDHPNAKSVICLNTLEIFNTIKEASLFYHINNRNICSCCQFKRKSAGKNNNGTPLKWMYYNNYLKIKKPICLL